MQSCTFKTQHLATKLVQFMLLLFGYFHLYTTSNTSFTLANEMLGVGPPPITQIYSQQPLPSNRGVLLALEVLQSKNQSVDYISHCCQKFYQETRPQIHRFLLLQPQLLFRRIPSLEQDYLLHWSTNCCLIQQQRFLLSFLLMNIQEKHLMGLL